MIARALVLTFKVILFIAVAGGLLAWAALEAANRWALPMLFERYVSRPLYSQTGISVTCRRIVLGPTDGLTMEDLKAKFPVQGKPAIVQVQHLQVRPDFLSFLGKNWLIENVSLSRLSIFLDDETKERYSVDSLQGFVRKMPASRPAHIASWQGYFLINQLSPGRSDLTIPVVNVTLNKGRAAIRIPETAFGSHRARIRSLINLQPAHPAISWHAEGFGLQFIGALADGAAAAYLQSRSHESSGASRLLLAADFRSGIAASEIWFEGSLEQDSLHSVVAQWTSAFTDVIRFDKPIHFSGHGSGFKQGEVVAVLPSASFETVSLKNARLRLGYDQGKILLMSTSAEQIRGIDLKKIFSSSGSKVPELDWSRLRDISVQDARMSWLDEQIQLHDFKWTVTDALRAQWAASAWGFTCTGRLDQNTLKIHVFSPRSLATLICNFDKNRMGIRTSFHAGVDMMDLTLPGIALYGKLKDIPAGRIEIDAEWMGWKAGDIQLRIPSLRIPPWTVEDVHLRFGFQDPAVFLKSFRIGHVTGPVITGSPDDVVVQVQSADFGDIKGYGARGLVMRNVEIRDINIFPEGNTLKLQEMNAWVVSLTPLRLILTLRNMRWLVPGSEPILVYGGLSEETLDVKIFSNKLSLETFIKPFSARFRQLKNIRGILTDLDVRLRGTLERPLIEGEFRIEKLSRVKYSVTNCPVKFMFEIKRSGPQLEFRGQITFARGTIYTERVKINLLPGTISFPEFGSGPVLDMAGNTSVEGTKIDIQVKGTPTKPSLNLSSEPPLSQERLLLMIVTGKAWHGTEKALQEGQLSLDVARNFVDYFFFGGETGRLAERLGVTDVRFILENGERGVEVRKEFTEKIDMGYGISQMYTGTATPATKHKVGAGYLLSEKRSIRLEAEQERQKDPEGSNTADQSQETSVLLKYKQKF